MPFKRGAWWYVRVPLEGGGDKIRALSTTDADYAHDVETAIRTLKRRRRWRELGAIAAGGRAGISFDAVRDAYSRDALNTLGAELDDVDLEPHIAGWYEAVALRYGNAARPGVAQSRTTPEHYRSEVRRLIAEGERFPRSRFTAATLRAYLAARPGKPATKVRAKAAFSSFAEYLISERLLTENPCRSVKLARVRTPDPRYLGLHEIEQLLARLPDEDDPIRTLETLSHATGMEIMALRRLVRRDVDLKRGRVRAPGTKTETRDRYASIDPWALPALTAWFTARKLAPTALVFPFLADPRGYARAKYHHTRAVEALGVGPYTMHDARHSWAVRYVAAGVPLEYVAHQLGHTDTTMVMRVYGKFRPAATDTARYQALAAARDTELRREADEAPSADAPDGAEVVNATDSAAQQEAASQIPLHAGADRAEVRALQ